MRKIPKYFSIYFWFLLLTRSLIPFEFLNSGQCYKRQMQPLEKTARFPFTPRKPHSIRLVEIPGGQKGIKLSADTIHGDSHRLTISQ